MRRTTTTVDFLLKRKEASWRAITNKRKCQQQQQQRTLLQYYHFGTAKRKYSIQTGEVGKTFSSSSSQLVLLRHGQSIWNKIPTFTGWCDVPLTPQGIAEAKEAGKLMFERGMEFDIAFTSELQRAKETCFVALEAMQEQRQDFNDNESSSVPVVEAWQLSERHYGALQGRAKNDPALIANYGIDQIMSWRRDFDATPPPMEPNHPYYQGPPAPLTESLADCQKRVAQYWHDKIMPELAQRGSRVLFVGHANTIRALVSFLDGTSREHIPHIHIANSVPCVYRIDPISCNAIPWFGDHADSASKGHWILSTDNQQRLLNKLGGNSIGFARSVFDAWDTNGDGVLSKEELIEGMSQWKRENDRALKVLAGSLWEDLINLGESEAITVEQFQSYAIQSSQRHNLPFFLSENAAV